MSISGRRHKALGLDHVPMFFRETKEAGKLSRSRVTGLRTRARKNKCFIVHSTSFRQHCSCTRVSPHTTFIMVDPQSRCGSNHLCTGEMAHSSYELIHVVPSLECLQRVTVLKASLGSTGALLVCSGENKLQYTNPADDLPWRSIRSEAQLFSGTTINDVYASSTQPTFTTPQEFRTDDRGTGKQAKCRKDRKVVVDAKNAGESTARISTN